MLFDQIRENHVHHYSYKAAGKTWTGKGKVVEKVKKTNGDRIIIEDRERGRTLTVYPSQVIK